MKLVTDYTPLEQRTQRAFDAAVEATLEDRRANAPRATGEYAASLERTGSGLSASIGSRLPQASTVERGADVGPRRGPHMRAVGTLGEAGDVFIRAMTDRLRAG